MQAGRPDGEKVLEALLGNEARSGEAKERAEAVSAHWQWSDAAPDVDGSEGGPDNEAHGWKCDACEGLLHLVEVPSFECPICDQKHPHAVFCESCHGLVCVNCASELQK